MTRLAAYIVLILLAFLFASSTPAWQVRVPTNGGFDDIVRMLEAPDARIPSGIVSLSLGQRVYLSACRSCHGDADNIKPSSTETWSHSPRDVFHLITWGHGMPLPEDFPYSGKPFELSKDHPAFPSSLDNNERWAVSMLVAVGGQTDSVNAANSGGAELYAAYCASCHGPRGYGNGPLSGDLSSHPRNLADTGWLAGQSDLHLFNIIESVFDTEPAESEKLIAGGMPAWGEILDSDEIVAIVSYLRSYGYSTGENPEETVDPIVTLVEPDTHNWTWREVRSKLPDSPSDKPEFLEE